MTEEFDAIRLNDRVGICEALYRFARGVDRREWELFRSAFHPDAYDEHGMYRGGIDGMVEWLKVRHAAITQSSHHIGNILVEFAAADKALVESYVVVYQRFAQGDRAMRAQMVGEQAAAQPGELDVVVCARYVDIFQRRSDWRILDRKTVFEHIEARVVPEFPRLSADWLTARRDGTDALYAQRRALGL